MLCNQRSSCGGFTESMHLAQMAQNGGKLIVPHCWKTGFGAGNTSPPQLQTVAYPIFTAVCCGVGTQAVLVHEELQIVDGK
jgi:hypothetical protein